MSWTVNVCPDHPVIEIGFSGRVTAEELADAFRATVELARAQGITRVIGDCTAMTGAEHTLFDLYFLADAGTTIGMPWREAVLVPADNQSAEKMKFWETTCANRGLSVRLFHVRQAALDWLLAEPDRSGA